MGSLIGPLGYASDPGGGHVQLLDAEDPRVEQIVSYAATLGIIRRDYNVETKQVEVPEGYYTIDYVHVFEPAEYAQAEYVWVVALDGRHRVLGWDRNAQRELMILNRERGTARTLLWDGPTFLVREKFRPVVDAESFVGMSYRPAHLCRSVSSKERGKPPSLKVLPWPAGQRLEEIWPTVELPPMYEPEIEWVRPHMPPPHTRQGPGKFVNPGFDDGQPVYTREAIASVGPFDIAGT